MNKKQTGRKKRWWILFVSILILVCFDQWTKHLAVQYLKEKEPLVLVNGVFELHYLENLGAAFGMLKNQRIVFLAMTIFIIAVVLYLYGKIPEKKHYLPLKILCIGILAGAVGNMIDRCLHGYVVDFLYFSLIDFPIFNVADIYVTVSAFVFLALYVFYYQEEDFNFLSSKKQSETTKQER